MMALLVTMIVCATLIYLAHLFLARRPLGHVRAPAPDAIDAAQEGAIPNDLHLAASKWHDAWAREQALRSIQELYDTTHDWDQVRFIFSQQDPGGDDS